MREKLEAVYEKGDKLYFLGFSRGAAAARKFLTMIEKDGLKTKDGEIVEMPPVEFLGCFDTVSMQFGIQYWWFNISTVLSKSITRARIVGEQDGKLSTIVKTAVHIVALDDNRYQKGFSPVYMDSNDERVHETWVAGQHGDSGGAKYNKGMPDCSCKYMQEWLEKVGISFISNEEIHPDCLKIDDFPDVKIDKSYLDIAPNPSDKIHVDGSKLSDPSYRPVVTVTNEEIVPGGTVRVHVSALQHMEAMDKKGTPYPFNPGLKGTDLVVVGPLDEPLEAETKRFKELIMAR